MKHKLNFYLDFIPPIAAIFFIGNFAWEVITNNVLPYWQNYVAFVFIAITIVLFCIRHIAGVLFFGLTLLLGLFNILTFTKGRVLSVGLGSEENGISTSWFQPSFLLWLLAYFIICHRYFFGIGTKKYWEEVRRKEK